MGTGVAVAAAGLVRVDRHYSKSLVDLALEAVDDALRDSGRREGIEFIVVSTAVGRYLTPQMDVGAYVASNLGIPGAKGISVEAGEASGLAAVLAGYHLAASRGRVLVIGVDKLSDSPASDVYSILKYAYYRYGEASYHIGHAAIPGLLARLYMERYKVGREELAYWPVMMHAHGKRNPYAMLRFNVTVESVMSGMPVADPLTLLDMFPLGDGASAIVLERGDGLARLAAVESATGPPSITVASDPLRLEAVSEAWRRAIRAAGLDGVDVVELHDSYSIMGLLILEELGLAERGTAAKMVAEGRFTEGGEGPLVNPSGGLKARGHPVGATGVYMVAELSMQLSGTFPGLQASDARKAAAVSINGHGSSAYTAILSRG